MPPLLWQDHKNIFKINNPNLALVIQSRDSYPHHYYRPSMETSKHFPVQQSIPGGTSRNPTVQTNCLSHLPPQQGHHQEGSGQQYWKPPAPTIHWDSENKVFCNFN